MCLDGLRAEDEAVADPLVGSALGHEREHLAFAVGELGERAVRSGPLDEAGDDGWVEDALAIAERLVVTERTVEAHVKQIFMKLGLQTNPDSHRRVRAVLAYLRGERSG